MRTSHRAHGISLRQLLSDSQFFGSPDIRIRSCCTVPEDCRPGDLYIALQTREFDGHEFVQQALERGASAVVAERLLPIAAPLCLVSDTREAHGQICQELAGQPTRHLRTIGVTGTNGKTNTSLLIASLLRTAAQPAGALTTLARDDGAERTPASCTTPQAPELAHWLSRISANGCTHAVVEVSSRALAEKRIAGLGFDVAVFTNLRRAHLNYHGTLDNYRQAKQRLLAQLKPEGFAVVNADDLASRQWLPRLNCPVLTFGLHSPAEVTATIVERQPGEHTFLLTAGCETAAVETRMFGDHHVYNCLSAAAVGLGLGLDLTTIARGLEACDQVPGCLEPLSCGQPFGVFIDSGRSPDALAVSLKTLRQITTGRVLCVYGADARQDRAERPLLGRVVERTAHLGIITNANPAPRREPPLQIAHDILDGYERPGRDHILPNRAEAIRWALSQARPGDAVLLSGHRASELQLVGDEDQGCDDREIARTWLSEVGAKLEYEQPSRPSLRLQRGAEAWN